VPPHLVLLTSDPADGLPEGPGGRQSHGDDGVSGGRQHAAARVHPVGAGRRAAKERVQKNTSGNGSDPIHGCTGASGGPACNRQADLLDQQEVIRE